MYTLSGDAVKAFVKKFNAIGDDFYSTDFLQVNYALPAEAEHDAFRLNICKRAMDFDPGVDVMVFWTTKYQGVVADVIFDEREIGKYPQDPAGSSARAARRAPDERP